MDYCAPDHVFPEWSASMGSANGRPEYRGLRSLDWRGRCLGSSSDPKRTFSLGRHIRWPKSPVSCFAEVGGCVVLRRAALTAAVFYLWVFIDQPAEAASVDFRARRDDGSP